MSILTQESILVLVKSEDNFPIDFDLAWQWAGYSTKQKALQALESNLEEGLDFLTLGLKNPEGKRGRPSKHVKMSVDGFKQFALMAGTEKGREVRKYFIECERRLKELISIPVPPSARLSPYWCDRLILYYQENKIPGGWWSIFEQTIKVVADLERYGYALPEGRILDISIGKCWAHHLQKDLRINSKNVARTYPHRYPGWVKPVDAYIYPASFLEEYHRWLDATYKPDKLPKYFKETDPTALPAVARMLGLPEGR